MNKRASTESGINFVQCLLTAKLFSDLSDIRMVKKYLVQADNLLPVAVKTQHHIKLVSFNVSAGEETGEVLFPIINNELIFPELKIDHAFLKEYLFQSSAVHDVKIIYVNLHLETRLLEMPLQKLLFAIDVTSISEELQILLDLILQNRYMEKAVFDVALDNFMLARQLSIISPQLSLIPLKRCDDILLDYIGDRESRRKVSAIREEIANIMEQIKSDSLEKVS